MSDFAAGRKGALLLILLIPVFLVWIISSQINTRSHLRLVISHERSQLIVLALFVEDFDVFDGLLPT